MSILLFLYNKTDLFFIINGYKHFILLQVHNFIFILVFQHVAESLPSTTVLYFTSCDSDGKLTFPVCSHCAYVLFCPDYCQKMVRGGSCMLLVSRKQRLVGKTNT